MLTSFLIQVMQAGAAPPLAVPVTVQADVSLWLVGLTALFNPALIACALWLGRDVGRKGEGYEKLLLAGFIAAFAGVALVWLGAYVRLPLAATVGRAAAGLFAVSILTGALWATIGRRFLR